MPASTRQSAEIVPYQAVIDVVPSIAAQIIPMAMTSAITIIVTQFTAAIPYIVVAVIAALIFGITIGLRIRSAAA